MIFRLATIFMTDEINSVEDYRIASNIVEGNGFSLISWHGPTAQKAPVYPYFLAAISYCTGNYDKIITVLVQHLILGLLFPLLLTRIGHKLHSPRAGYVIANLFLLHPSYIYYPNVLEVTNILLPLMAICILAFLKVLDSGRLKWRLVYGALGGLLALTQPVFLPLLALSWIYLMVRRSLRQAVVVCAVSIIAIAPWTLRNYMEFGEIIAVKSPFWLNLYLGYLPENHGREEYDLLDKRDIARFDSLKECINDYYLEEECRRAVQPLIQRAPELYLEKSLYQAYLFWTWPPRYFGNNSMSFLMVRKLPVILFSVLFLASLIVGLKRYPRLTLLLAGALLFTTIVYALTSAANIRYKLDVEWLELILIGLMIVSKGRSELPAPAEKH